MTDKDKTVGGRTREEWLLWFDWQDKWAGGTTALVDVAFNQPDYSRGLRDGLERAAKPILAAWDYCKGEWSKHSDLCILCRVHIDDHESREQLIEQAIAAIRAEASKLDVEEQDSTKAILGRLGYPRPEPPAEALCPHGKAPRGCPDLPPPAEGKISEERANELREQEKARWLLALKPPAEERECGVRFGYNNGSANHSGDGPNVFDRCRLKPSHIGPHGYPVGYKRVAEERKLPLGHEFDPKGALPFATILDICQHTIQHPAGDHVCGQPRSAHEPKP